MCSFCPSRLEGTRLNVCLCKFDVDVTLFMMFLKSENCNCPMWIDLTVLLCFKSVRLDPLDVSRSNDSEGYDTSRSRGRTSINSCSLHVCFFANSLWLQIPSYIPSIELWRGVLHSIQKVSDVFFWVFVFVFLFIWGDLVVKGNDLKRLFSPSGAIDLLANCLVGLVTTR